ncbi:hypothetical protein Ancab_001001 [Ancistrocladus abbreviatus]
MRFLNSYYVRFANAYIFDPDLSPDELKSRPLPEMQRLSTLYNADAGLYMLANKEIGQHFQNLFLEPERAKVLMMTFLSNFFCYFLFSLFSTGSEPFDSLCRSSLFECVRHLFYKMRSGVSLAYSVVSPSAINFSQQPYNSMLSKVPAILWGGRGGGMSVAVCFMAAVISLGVALLIVPRQVISTIYQWGRERAAQKGFSSSENEALTYDSVKGFSTLTFDLPRCVQTLVASDIVWSTLYMSDISGCSLIVMLLCGLLFWEWFFWSLLLHPCLSFWNHCFVPKVRLDSSRKLFLASFMSYASEHLSIRSFLGGLKDQETPRARSLCLP